MSTTPDPKDPDDTTMTFDTALVCLRQGVKVRRESWDDGHQLAVASGEQAIHDEKGAEWTPTTADLFAGDWEVI